MLPRWHILWGAVFTAVLWIAAPGTSWMYLGLVFLASVFIDLDHYIVAAMSTGTFHLRDAFDYHTEKGLEYAQNHAKGIREKGDFHLFHTIEFQALVGILGILWTPFFYIFIGLVFHSLLDLFYMLYHDVVYRREFFFFNWLAKLAD